LAGVPKALESAQVEALLASCDRGTATGRRDFAILTLLARLGLRAGEVAALGQDEVDWRRGEITVRGKANRHDALPLPADVGQFGHRGPPWSSRETGSRAAPQRAHGTARRRASQPRQIRRPSRSFDRVTTLQQCGQAGRTTFVAPARQSTSMKRDAVALDAAGSRLVRGVTPDAA
jgi:integrase